MREPATTIAPDPQSHSSPRRVKLLSDIQPKATEWLWPERRRLAEFEDSVVRFSSDAISFHHLLTRP